MRKTVKIRNLILGDDSPKICVPVVAETQEALEAAAAALGNVPFDLVEFRADYFPELLLEDAKGSGTFSGLINALHLLRNALGEKPLLFTVRTAGEGGKISLSYTDYARVLLFAAQSGLADLIDVELFTAGEQAGALTRALHDAGAFVIGSSHDFKHTPPRVEMRSRLLRMQEEGMDICKLAVMPTCRQDVSELITLSCEMADADEAIPFVTMSMGSLGVITRVCGSLTGSAITFASAGRASAPGQLDASLMRQILDAL